MNSSDHFYLQSMDSPDPFLPINDVLPAWTELKTKIWILYPSSYISDYINYFETTWLFSTSYPISMWNVTSAVEYDEPRTNNASEGGNNALNRAFKAAHPSLWTFLTNFGSSMLRLIPSISSLLLVLCPVNQWQRNGELVKGG